MKKISVFLSKLKKCQFSKKQKSLDINTFLKKKDSIEELELINYVNKRFTDKIRLEVQGGTGGIGCFSNIRTRAIKTANKDGGNGGRGGNVFFKAVADLDSNLSYIKKNLIKGNTGKNGKTKVNHGKDGKDFHFSLPLGTKIYKIIFNDKNKEKRVYVNDLKIDKKACLVAKGGLGGLGSKDKGYKPFLQKGKEGEKILYELNLSIKNDIVFLGMTLSGKSTLLANLTRTITKISDKGPNTLYPITGKLKFINNKELVILDMPPFKYRKSESFIDKFEFGHHFDYSKLLCIVLDSSSEDINNQIVAILNYLKNVKVEGKSILFILNKVDLINEERKKSLNDSFKKLEFSFVFMSGLNKIGFENFFSEIEKFIT